MKKVTTIALVAVAAMGLSLTGCKSKDKAADNGNGAETMNDDAK